MLNVRLSVSCLRRGRVHGSRVPAGSGAGCPTDRAAPSVASEGRYAGTADGPGTRSRAGAAPDKRTAGSSSTNGGESMDGSGSHTSRDEKHRHRGSALAVGIALVLATIAASAAVVAGSAGATGSQAGAATTGPKTLPAVQTVGFDVSATVVNGATTTTLLTGTGAADFANGDGTTTLTIPALSGLLGSNDTVTAVWQGSQPLSPGARALHASRRQELGGGVPRRPPRHLVARHDDPVLSLRSLASSPASSPRSAARSVRPSDPSRTGPPSIRPPSRSPASSRVSSTSRTSTAPR